MSQANAAAFYHLNHAGDRVQLNVANQGLGPFVHSAPGQAVLGLPGRNVAARPLVVTVARICTSRPSYINGILVQSRGHLPLAAPALRRAAGPCTACSTPGQVNPGGGKAFPECRHLPGHFGGSCGNCKWQDHAVRCSVRDGALGAPSDESSDGDEDEESEESWEGCGESESESAGVGGSKGAAASSSSGVISVVVPVQ